MWHIGQPFSGIAFTSLDEGLTNCLVLLLNDAIHMGVIRGDVDVTDTIPVCKPVQGSNVGCAIVGDNFFNGAPP